MAVCLICERSFCLQYCVTESGEQKSGNLIRHAREHHLGQALYLDIFGQTEVLISEHKNGLAKDKFLYIDELGQSVLNSLDDDGPTDPKFDFLKYKKNP